MATQIRRNSRCGEAEWTVWLKFAVGATTALGLCGCTPPWKIMIKNETGRDVQLSIIADNPHMQDRTIKLAPSHAILMPFELGEIQQVRYQYDDDVCVLAPSDIVSRAYPIRHSSKQTQLDLTPCSPDSGPA